MNVKLCGELSAAALKSGLDKELGLWYELRSINYWGSGRLAVDDAIDVLVSHFGYSERTVRRLLKSGNGIFWRIPTNGYLVRRTKIEIYGLLRMSGYFNVSHLGCFVRVPLKDWVKNKRAWLYASLFKPDGSTKVAPISRDSIQVATGVDRRQQRRYDRAIGIKLVANFALQEIEGHLAPIMMQMRSKAKVFWKQRRLGNIYYSPASRAPRGMVKRVNALLKQRSFSSDKARLPKRFFLTPQSAIKTPEKADEAFLLVRKKDRLISGRKEWCLLS
jgi:hypothetical protein